MNKLKAIIRLILSKNWYVICDRSSSGNVRIMFVKSFIAEMKKVTRQFEGKYKARIEQSATPEEGKE